jgi:hypothetical protein
MPEPDGGAHTSAFSWIRRILRPVRRRLPDLTEGARVDRDEEMLRQKLRVQVNVIRSAFGEKVEVARDGGEDDADVAFLCRPGHVVVRSVDVDRLRSYFDGQADTYSDAGRVVEEPLSGLALYEIPARRDTGRAELLRTLDDLDRDLGSGVVTPDHVLYVASIHGSLCPATEPEEPAGTTPVPPLAANANLGAGVRVSVVDTGWWAPCAQDGVTPWLAGVTGDAERIDTHAIGPYAGHGTFVSGVVRCLAPASRVEVEGFLTRGGAVYESEIVRQLDEALLDADRPQLISISAGTHTRNDLALLSFEVLAGLHGMIDGDRGPLVIAAAGNDGNDAPFWPAAFDWVVGVGSLDADGTVSDYSNYGPWVNVYAQGRNLVNAFPTGTYTCYEPLHRGEVRTFAGLAQWSGTSFSTPVVTGSIAAYMSMHHASARQARDQVLHGGRPLHDARAGSIVAVGPPFV